MPAATFRPRPFSVEDRVCVLAPAASAFAGRWDRAGDVAYDEALALAEAGLPTQLARASRTRGRRQQPCRRAGGEEGPGRRRDRRHGRRRKGRFQYWKQAGTWLEEERAEYRLTRSLLQAGRPRKRSKAPGGASMSARATTRRRSRLSSATPCWRWRSVRTAMPTAFAASRQQALALFEQVPVEESGGANPTWLSSAADFGGRRGRRGRLRSRDDRLHAPREISIALSRGRHRGESAVRSTPRSQAATRCTDANLMRSARAAARARRRGGARGYRQVREPRRKVQRDIHSARRGAKNGEVRHRSRARGHQRVPPRMIERAHPAQMGAEMAAVHEVRQHRLHGAMRVVVELAAHGLEHRHERASAARRTRGAAKETRCS